MSGRAKGWRFGLTIAVTCLAMVLGTQTASASRVIIQTNGGGHCNFDDFIQRTAGLVFDTIYYGSQTECIGVPQISSTHGHAVLREEGREVDQTQGAGYCVTFPCRWTDTYASAWGFYGYTSVSDGVLNLYPPGSTKNPFGVRFVSSSSSACVIINSGYSAVCGGVFDFSPKRYL